MNFFPTVHDFYSPHMHPVPGHMATSNHTPTTPPLSTAGTHFHQIHNPTPSYYHHSSPLGLSSSGNNTTSATGYSSPLTVPIQNHLGNESPSQNDQYNTSIQLPPTPNSLITIMGPTSGNTFENSSCL